MPENSRRRLEPQPGEAIDRSAPLEFEFDGRQVRGFRGDTIASALYAEGIRVFSRSFKYHRPRGLLCCAGNCPNCLVSVGGEPNVRACARAAEQGLQVYSQNAWPSLGFDLLSLLDRLHWLMPVGFYYKAMHRPKALWLMGRQLIRRVGGLGSIDIGETHEAEHSSRSLHTDVAVVGGGPAGISAALAAAESGSRVTLIDDQPSLGGHLRYVGLPADTGNGERRHGTEIARELAEQAAQLSNVCTMSGSTAFGFYQDNLLAVLTAKGLVRLRAKRVVLATGNQESPLLFENNDLPGVMLSTAARRLISLFGVRPGRQAVVATETPEGYEAALDLLNAGVKIAAVADASEGADTETARTLTERGVTVLTAHRLVRASGRSRVRSVWVAPVGESGSPPGRRIDCDLVCMSGAFHPADALLRQTGACQPAVTLAGSVNGASGLSDIIEQGREAGLIATGARSSRLSSTERKIRPVPPLYADQGTRQRTYVCFCEDVSAHDIEQAIDEGFADVQTLKRYTTVTMGPCQGKMCGPALAGICSARADSDDGAAMAGDTYTTSRPPYRPVSLSILAGRKRIPLKRTPLDHVHRELGARMVESGPWLRPHSYGSPADECAAVRDRVGIIDVSTLGKMEVVGAGAPQLLDRLYTHSFSDLPVGRIRYGLMTSDNGVILDDGTVTRLAEDRYFVTTTSGSADVIEEWFNWWNAGAAGCAHTVNVTAAFGAVNVAGPRARETLAKLTGIDLSRRRFPYMRSAQGDVAGVPCLLLRIGFVGEAGWEVHFPAECGEYMWDAIMEAGREFGIAPFGLEAQRVLRLEKGHVIVGQDTDAVSTPLDAGSEWAVRFDKGDFIGRGGLEAAMARGGRQRLVGFVMPIALTPEDGTPVISGGRPVGRVTSARLSPTMNRGFGLAWVPPEMAREGAFIDVLIGDRPISARVTLRPVYDPDGRRLRS